MNDNLLDKATSQGGYLAIKELPMGEFFKRKHSAKRFTWKKTTVDQKKNINVGTLKILAMPSI